MTFYHEIINGLPQAAAVTIELVYRSIWFAAIPLQTPKRTRRSSEIGAYQIEVKAEDGLMFHVICENVRAEAERLEQAKPAKGRRDSSETRTSAPRAGGESDRKRLGAVRDT